LVLIFIGKRPQGADCACLMFVGHGLIIRV